jgi:hypothetical protein
MRLALFGPPANGKTPVEWRMVSKRQSRSPNNEAGRPAGARLLPFFSHGLRSGTLPPSGPSRKSATIRLKTSACSK